jgi:hypothetical protein
MAAGKFTWLRRTEARSEIRTPPAMRRHSAAGNFLFRSRRALAKCRRDKFKSLNSQTAAH